MEVPFTKNTGKISDFEVVDIKNSVWTYCYIEMPVSQRERRCLMGSRMTRQRYNIRRMYVGLAGLGQLTHGVYSFLRTSVTNNHDFCGLQQQKLLFLIVLEARNPKSYRALRVL